MFYEFTISHIKFYIFQAYILKMYVANIKVVKTIVALKNRTWNLSKSSIFNSRLRLPFDNIKLYELVLKMERNLQIIKRPNDKTLGKVTNSRSSMHCCSTQIGWRRETQKKKPSTAYFYLLFFFILPKSCHALNISLIHKNHKMKIRAKKSKIHNFILLH